MKVKICSGTAAEVETALNNWFAVNGQRVERMLQSQCMVDGQLNISVTIMYEESKQSTGVGFRWQQPGV